MQTTPKVVETQSRWKSSILWASIIAQVLVILQLTGAFAKIGLDAGFIGNVVAAVLQLLVTVGVLNNPTSANTF
jgi:uncharacterized membrane protein